MIRRSRSGDRAWIARVSAEVYGPLGDYGTIIPSWLDHVGVLAYVEEVATVRRGFILVGFYEPVADSVRTSLDVHGASAMPAGDATPAAEGGGTAAGPGGLIAHRAIADLLAIAVAPEHQQRGVGRALLAYAIDVARIAGRANGISEIRLTVADDNRVGKRLYRRSGFRVLDENHGCYDGGQRAIRMARSL